MRFGHESSPEFDVPEAGAELWTWFWDLHRDRTQGPNGPQPITSRDILAWSELTGIIVRPDEVEVLRTMDGAYRAAFAEEVEAIREREADARKAAR